jgi:hypothetical protein
MYDGGDGWSGTHTGETPRPSLIELINQILGGSGGIMPPSKTKGSDFYKWLQNLFKTGTTGGATIPPSTTPPTDLQGILSQLMKNSGKAGAPISSMGAVVSPMLTSPGFDPYTYGQTSGEATFYHQTPQNTIAPIAALPGLGAPPPASTVTDKKKKD